MSINFIPTEIVRLYRIWTSILYRCTRTKNKQFKNYGGRGISICDEWKDFNVFCNDIYQGSKSGLHLDRIDNEKGYFKGNCRWTSPKVNHRNKRNNKYYETHIGRITQSELIENIKYTRKQFQRALEKHGIEEFLIMYKENRLPKKRVVADLNEFIGKRFGKLIVEKLDEDKSTGARYFCRCDCGRTKRIARFKLMHEISLECVSCARSGDKNPKRREMIRRLNN